MYIGSTAATLETLLTDLSKYRTCEITSYTAKPIINEAHQFQRKNAAKYYAEIDNKKE